jgi:hypothetical protein
MASNPDPSRRPPDHGVFLTLSSFRMVRIIISVVGILIALGSFFLGYFQRNAFTGLEALRNHWGWVLLVVAMLFGGLGAALVCLQAMKPDERTDPKARIALYGFNAVLSAVLLFLILLVINVLVYLPLKPFSYLSATYNWTAGSANSLLSDASKEVLERVDRPVKVYVLLAPDELLGQEMTTLLHNARVYSSRIDYEQVNPDEQPLAVDRLEKDYNIPERSGVLLVYGTKPDEKTEFIQRRDLFEVKGGGRPGEDDSGSILFKGENALITKLNYLSENRSSPVVYFTQGSGEVGFGGGFGGQEESLGELKRRLEQINYKVEELKFGLESKPVPDDAAVVVIARPTQPLPANALESLRDFVNKRSGKLIVLTDVIQEGDGPMKQTVEPFLAEFGVEVGNDRLVAARSARRSPLMIVAAGPPRSTNPIAKRFRNAVVTMADARSVSAAANPNPLGGGYTAEPVLVTPPEQYIWKEANLGADPLKIIRDANRDPARQRELLGRISETPISVAVAVGKPKTDPTDPHAGFRPSGMEPRLVVFGDTNWATDQYLGADGNAGFELFSVSLSWLRDRPDLGTLIPPKERDRYVVKSDNLDNLFAFLKWVPMAVMVVGIVGLGAAVWVVRRR